MFLHAHAFPLFLLQEIPLLCLASPNEINPAKSAPVVRSKDKICATKGICHTKTLERLWQSNTQVPK